MPRPNGIVLYQGPSRLDDQPIVAILTGLASPSINRKTGEMLQSWILAQDQHPVDALGSGLDRSVCGECPHRPEHLGTCYVQVGRAPAGIWRAWKRGAYPDYDPGLHDRYLDDAAIRFGAYGDPAAVPVSVWENLHGLARTHTGYTHQWRGLTPDWHRLVMASCDSEAEAALAQSRGWRTFRVRRADDELLDTEIICPASDEFIEARGRKVQCIDCGLCAGTSRAQAKSIAIIVHGQTKRRFDLTLHPPKEGWILPSQKHAE